MTPGNYCTHAIEFLKQDLVYCWRKGPTHQEDGAWLSLLVEDLPKAEKFLMPDSGRILTGKQDLTVLQRNLKIPFHHIALEYTIGLTDKKEMFAFQMASSRRIVYCIENNAATGYWVTTIDWIDQHRIWQACPILVRVPYDISLADLAVVDDDSRIGWEGKFQYKIVMPGCFEHMLRVMKLTRNIKLEQNIQETLWDWESVFHLTNFLACSNATTERLPPPPKLQAKRLAAGKVPLYEYRLLKIAAERSQNASQRTGITGGHVSPRQHVRRGHIRHFKPYDKRADPTKRPGYTKWIEQMIVGDAERGVIEKDYSIV